MTLKKILIFIFRTVLVCLSINTQVFTNIDLIIAIYLYHFHHDLRSNWLYATFFSKENPPNKKKLLLVVVVVVVVVVIAAA